VSGTLLWAVGGVLFAAGLLFGKVFTANFELTAKGKLRKAVGVVSVVAGALMVLRAAGFLGAPVHAEGGAEVKWLTDVEAAEKLAQAEKKPLLVDFGAEWCKACKELEAETFPAPPVADHLKHWVTAHVDLTNDKPELRPLQERFGVVGLPTVALVDAQGKLRKDLTLTGFEPPDAFLTRLGHVESGDGTDSPTLASRITAALDEGSLWVYVLVFLAGIVGSLSPCVYPLIPITISLFGARDAKSRMQGFLLSLVYVLGITATYSTLGVVAASAGKVFGNALQSGWVIVTVAVVFVAMGLSMLGAFEIRLPAVLGTRLNQVGGGEGKRFLGAFVMGTVAGVIAAPCVGPPLVAVLSFVAAHGDVPQGLGLLSVYSLGMGLLFIVLGTFTQLLTRMPKSGGWMEAVKGSLGIIMLVVGAVYLYDLLPIGT
jgi:thiol:disulfide interchange protein